jgi:hypothetical protein
MKSPITHMSFALLLSLLLIGIEHSAAGASVTISFSGRGTGASVNHTFTGSFTYNPGYVGSGGIFDQHSWALREFTYIIDVGSQYKASGNQIDSYTITTCENNYWKFHVVVHRKSAIGVPELYFEVVLAPTVVMLSDTNLPPCDTPVFPQHPTGGTSTFKLSGGTTFTGNIDTIANCSVMMEECRPACCPSTACCPVYACQPRRSGFLSRMKASCAPRRCAR